MDDTKSKLNVNNLVTFILLFVVGLLGAHLSGILKFDIKGLLAGLVFMGTLIFIGYLADKFGVVRYSRWDKQIKQDKP